MYNKNSGVIIPKSRKVSFKDNRKKGNIHRKTEVQKLLMSVRMNQHYKKKLDDEVEYLDEKRKIFMDQLEIRLEEIEIHKDRYDVKIAKAIRRLKEDFGYRGKGFEGNAE